MVRRLVEAFDPVAIYLFGSRARGDAGEDSDYDLMLVLADDNDAGALQAGRLADRPQPPDRRQPVPHPDAEPSPGAGTRSARWSTRFRSTASGCIRLRARICGPMERRDGEEPRSMNAKVVAEWLERVERDLVMARRAAKATIRMPDQAAYHVQQAAEKLTKAALVAHAESDRARATRSGSSRSACRPRSRIASAFSPSTGSPTTSGRTAIRRGPRREPPPVPSVAEVRAWIAEIEALKADFERWLAQREAQP